MRLTREIERQLVDGERLLVSRSWVIAFTPALSSGWVVDGEQVAVSVDAPPALNALAKIEEQRETPEAFPIVLDQHGMIVLPGENNSSLDMHKVHLAAENIVSGRGGDLSDRTALVQFVLQLQDAANTIYSNFPRDLFFPAVEPQTRREVIALANGLEGEVEVSYAADVHAGSRLLRRSSRRIATRIAGEVLHSEERWSLGEA